MTNSLPSAPAPAVGSQLTVTIYDVAFGGEGVARVDDFVLFVLQILYDTTALQKIQSCQRRRRMSSEPPFPMLTPKRTV